MHGRNKQTSKAKQQPRKYNEAGDGESPDDMCRRGNGWTSLCQLASLPGGAGERPWRPPSWSAPRCGERSSEARSARGGAGPAASCAAAYVCMTQRSDSRAEAGPGGARGRG
jgi:hypothetical protein